MLLVENRLNVVLSSGSFLSFSFLSSSIILPIISLTLEGFGGEKKMIECWNKTEQPGWTAATLSIVQESGRSFG